LIAVGQPRSVLELKDFLDSKVEEYNQVEFIRNDPVCVPHNFHDPRDIEISGLWTSVLAWGLRKTIIRNCTLLFELMDNAPYDFVVNHQDNDLKKLLNFKHRTFNTTDTLYFVSFFNHFYKNHHSLEEAFSLGMSPADPTMEKGLRCFHDLFFDLDHAPPRTRKHISTPARNSACKRLNMFLRWMVRQDNSGVDFGIWTTLKPSQLVCPLDVHVDRVARHLGLIKRKQSDWQTALELTDNLRTLDPEDPVKYDYALFGLGVMEKYAI